MSSRADLQFNGKHMLPLAPQQSQIRRLTPGGGMPGRGGPPGKLGGGMPGRGGPPGNPPGGPPAASRDAHPCISTGVQQPKSQVEFQLPSAQGGEQGGLWECWQCCDGCSEWHPPDR